jgi:DNA primase
LIRGLLDELELVGYVKTSGADGIHVLAPIQRRSSFEETYNFAEAIGHPGRRTIAHGSFSTNRHIASLAGRFYGVRRWGNRRTHPPSRWCNARGARSAPAWC